MLLARRTLSVIRQNLWWAAGYNLVALPLAISGHLTPGWPAWHGVQLFAGGQQCAGGWCGAAEPVARAPVHPDNLIHLNRMQNMKRMFNLWRQPHWR